MATSFSINSKDSSNKKYQRNITHVNPDATDEKILALAQGINNLSTNQITGVNRIDTIDLLNDTRITRNVFFSSTSNPPGTRIDNPSTTLAAISTDIQTPTQIFISGDLTGVDYNKVSITFNAPDIEEFILASIELPTTEYLASLVVIRSDFEQQPTGEGTITLHFPGSTNYKPATLTYSIVNE